MSKITWSLLDTWLSIISSILLIISYFVGFFKGKTSGLEIAQEQDQEIKSGKQKQKQTIKL